MDGFHSVVVGASLVREGRHADRNCVERRRVIEYKRRDRGDKTRALAKSVVVREVRLKRREYAQVSQRKTEIKN